ncbi:unnamed protein product [Phytomonas sp. Hart1]|nr:unnamed protein product [Phytomonas sp. Hart1]|eukprot:CCW66561.1 unnamed protein product [Phytomonas sp. isolate Hart1]
MYLLLILSLLKSIKPYFAHSFAAFPFSSIFIGLVLLFIVTLAAHTLCADTVMRLYRYRHLNRKVNLTSVDKAALASQWHTVLVPSSYEAFCRVNITASTVYASAIFCLVIFFFHRTQCAYYLYIRPILRDIARIEEKVWVDFDDWRDKQIPKS